MKAKRTVDVTLVKTIHGEEVPVRELAHISPALHPFAIRIERLMRDPDNARKHTKRDLGVTANSLRRFGQTMPILYRPDDHQLIAGNGRHEAASNLLDWKYIAAVPFNGTRSQARAYGLADNRTAELSEWDQEKLSELIAEFGDPANLEEEMNGFDLEEIGFGEDDIAEIEEELTEKTKKKSTAVEAKQVESVPGKFYNIVIKCGSEKHQTALLQALMDGKPKELVKLLNGADIRTQN